ncbi:DHHW family protein [Paenibacillus methanolicus]|uniref:DHHW motif protein n=1 Tax=Paenibacillus methanolicus TaxID=582686 RepID=A0A5S5BQD0_9BACL|nr:DHHW family protein [Paenibacillus methanolicus]TYP69405.1 DHHW motif protein [Paenibacillus methanolicus]
MTSESSDKQAGRTANTGLAAETRSAARPSPRADRLLVAGFLAALAVMPALYLILPGRTFSETENRPLQAWPELSWSKVKDKTFADEAEEYVTDHFPLRDRWVWAKSSLEQLRLQLENNGIYKGKDGYLFEKFAEPDWTKLDAQLAAVQAFARRHLESRLTFLLAPTSIGVYPDRLPWKAVSYPQTEVNRYIGDQLRDSLAFVDGFDVLAPAAEKPIYYRTDHHWTTYSAYLAYRASSERMGWTPRPETGFDVRDVSASFLGSFHTRGQFSGITPDTIQAYVPKHPVSVEVTVADTGDTSGSLYAPAYLKKKDQYSYFLGGVHALMTIKSDLAKQERKLDKLLVIKDSYAHSVIPFLAQDVAELHVVDMRYYNGSVDGYMKEHSITNVLMLYNTATFTGAADLLKLAR